MTIDNKPGYLWLVSPGQINVQAPDDTATGIVPVVVTTPNGIATSTVTLGQFGLSFSLLSTQKACRRSHSQAGRLGGLLRSRNELLRHPRPDRQFPRLFHGGRGQGRGQALEL